jgi:ABC-type dipeptide/oligopeptide/nickel transport system permease component
MRWREQRLVQVGQSVLSLDLGFSFRDNQPVLTRILARLGPTLLLMGVTLVLAVLLGAILGLVAAARPGTWRDTLVSLVALVASFLPTAWWLCTIPGLAILVTVLAINLAGEGLNDALNPASAAADGPGFPDSGILIGSAGRSGRGPASSTGGARRISRRPGWTAARGRASCSRS